MDGEVGWRTLGVEVGYGAMHGLDDVATQAEVAQRRLGPGLEAPGRRPKLFSKAEPFERLGAADHQATQVGVRPTARRAQVEDAPTLIACRLKCAVEPGPALGGDILLQTRSDLLL